MALQKTEIFMSKNNPMTKKEQVAEGLEYSNVFNAISNETHTANELQCLSSLFIEVRDAINNQEQSSLIETEELTAIFLKSLDVFDTPKQAKGWLESICPALSNCSPVSLLTSVEGRELVSKTLRYIEYGEFS